MVGLSGLALGRKEGRKTNKEPVLNLQISRPIIIFVRIEHCLTRSDVTSVERGVRMSQCGQAPLGMRIEGVGDSHIS